MKKRVFFLVLCILLLQYVSAQQEQVDTVLQLNTLSISAERYEAFSAGQKVSTLNLAKLRQEPAIDLGQLMNRNSSVYIRSYGQGSISSMSFRGTSSAQSGIFWNGINIRMPSLGSTDLSLVPAGLFDQASIAYGGSSMRYGSGTIGGAVFLNNVANFDKRLEGSIGFLAGSYNTIGSSASVMHSTDKWYLKLDFTSKNAQNDFGYTSSRGEEKTMENAALAALGLNAHAATKVAERNQLDVFFWYQEALREIPPTTSMAFSDAYQSDRAFRSSLQWKSIFRKGVLNIKSAWFAEYENFTDPAIALSSEINTNTWFLESEFRYPVFRNASINTGLSYTAEIADIDAYDGKKDRQGMAAFLNYKHHLPGPRWTILAGARQEFVGNTIAPFTPTIGMEGPLTSFLLHKINISRNYRMPSMNELYWQPGGNPDIEPEESWNGEISLIADLFRKHKELELNISATAYTSLVDNWILWQPDNNFWSASNLQKVWARGLEAQLQFNYATATYFFRTNMSYTYSKSTNEADTRESIKGNQIIYTPLHNASGSIEVGWKSWEAGLFGNYTGKSYVTTDNKEVLPAVYLTDLRLKKEFNIKYLRIALVARVNNLFDKEYQLVAYRPMPGRNYQLALQINFKN